MIRYLIVDDEPLAHKLIEGYCNNLPHLVKQENCYDAIEAMQFLTNNTVDLIFLDIHMPKLKGFDFLRALSHPPKIIVTTAYEEFALEGFELKVSDYLLKPYSFERFIKAINNAFSNSGTTRENEHELTSGGSIFIKGDKKYHQINIGDILFIEAYGNYTKLHFKDDIILSHVNISSFEKDLRNKNFIRTHKSYIVSKPKIEIIEGNRILIGKHKIPIGQTYKGAISKMIN